MSSEMILTLICPESASQRKLIDQALYVGRMYWTKKLQGNDERMLTMLSEYSV